MKIFHSYVKSKPIFKIHFFSLSKLVEQAEIRLFYDFQVCTNLNYLNYKKLIQSYKIESRDFNSALDDPKKRQKIFIRPAKVNFVMPARIIINLKISLMSCDSCRSVIKSSQVQGKCIKIQGNWSKIQSTTLDDF